MRSGAEVLGSARVAGDAGVDGDAQRRQTAHLRALRAACAPDVATRAHPDAQLYALVDVGLQPAALPWAKRLRGEAAALFEGTPEAALGDLSPRLARIGPAGELADEASATFLRAAPLLAWHEALPCVSWLASAATLSELAEHLRGRLTGQLCDEDGQPMGEVMLRYYDARVLAGYLQTLTETQYALALQPLVWWGLWNRHAQWQQWGPPADVPSHLGLKVKAAQRFSLAQHAAIAAHTATDRIDARLRELYGTRPESSSVAAAVHEQLLSLPARSRFVALDRIVERARQAGLQVDPDLLLYATFHHSLGPRFAEHPQMQACLAAVRTQGGTFIDATMTLPDEAWDAIAQTARS